MDKIKSVKKDYKRDYKRGQHLQEAFWRVFVYIFCISQLDFFVYLIDWCTFSEKKGRLNKSFMKSRKVCLTTVNDWLPYK